MSMWSWIVLGAGNSQLWSLAWRGLDSDEETDLKRKQVKQTNDYKFKLIIIKCVLLRKKQMCVYDLFERYPGSQCG